VEGSGGKSNRGHVVGEGGHVVGEGGVMEEGSRHMVGNNLVAHLGRNLDHRLDQGEVGYRVGGGEDGCNGVSQDGGNGVSQDGGGDNMLDGVGKDRGRMGEEGGRMGG